MNKKYNQEHIDFIKVNIQGCPFKDLTDKFNERFGTSLKITTLTSLAARHGLTNGLVTRFNKGHQPTQYKKGHTPWNKGVKGVATGGKETQYKPGHKPSNWRPIGSERVNGDGYVDIKVQDGAQHKNWKGKHILIWEEHNGLVPPGHAVIFGDGNRFNFDPKNLVLVSKKQLVRMNYCGLIQDDAELTRAGIIIADIYNKIGERKRDGKGKQCL